MLKMHTQWEPIVVTLSYDPDEITGFQNHAAENISTCLQRFASGDTSVYHYSDDDAYAYREQYFDDDFARLDRLVSDSDRSPDNPVSSDSGVGAHPSASSDATNPGDTVIDPGDHQSGRNPEPGVNDVEKKST